MSRLTEKLTDARNIIRGHHSAVFSTKYGHFIEGELVDKLADYEDKQEQGLIAQCTCGDCIHVDCSVCSCETVYCMALGAYRNVKDSCNKAEAEEALARIKGE